MPLKPLKADLMLWAPTWNPDEYADTAGRPYFNRRTGEFVLGWDLAALDPDRGPFDGNAEIMSWPDADREVVPLFADQQAAESWLADRGFAVEWVFED